MNFPTSTLPSAWIIDLCHHVCSFLINKITNDVESWLSSFESYIEKLLYFFLYYVLMGYCYWSATVASFTILTICTVSTFMLNDWMLPFLTSPRWALISKVILSNMDFLILHCYAGHAHLRVRHEGIGILCFKFIAGSRICLFLPLRLFSRSLQLVTWPYYTKNQSRWQITLPPLKERLYTAEIRAFYECNTSYWNQIFRKTFCSYVEKKIRVQLSWQYIGSKPHICYMNILFGCCWARKT